MNIPYETRAAVYKAAIEHYGPTTQIWKAVEEMAELLNELAKGHSGKGTSPEALIDEIADVTVMMEQLRHIFGANDAVQSRIDFKVRRMAQRIGREELVGC